MHRPYTEDPIFKGLAPAEAAKAYAQMLDRVSQYLREMEAPEPIVQIMISTGSGEIKWVEDKSENRPPSFTEWAAASCGHFTNSEYESMIALQVKRNYPDSTGKKDMTNRESLLLDELQGKWRSKNDCESKLISTNRSRLTAP